MPDTYFPDQLAAMEAEQSGDPVPALPRCASGQCVDPRECWLLARCADLHTPEHLDNIESHSGERAWAMRANQGRGDE